MSQLEQRNNVLFRVISSEIRRCINTDRMLSVNQIYIVHKIGNKSESLTM